MEATPMAVERAAVEVTPTVETAEVALAPLPTAVARAPEVAERAILVRVSRERERRDRLMVNAKIGAS
jgi:hypothetical protein